MVADRRTWIPAFAGMTVFAGMMVLKLMIVAATVVRYL
jgi:hypothetical protein